MTEVILYVGSPHLPDLSDKSLNELAEIAGTAHEEAEEGLAGALLSTIKCGQALLVAKEKVPRGEWDGWREENFPYGKYLANSSMRLAYYAHLLPSAVFEPTHTKTGNIVRPSVIRALGYLRGLPGTSNPGRPRRIGDDTRAEVRGLIQERLSDREIAAIIGISHTSVANIRDPEHYRRTKKKQAEQRKKQVQARRELVEKQKVKQVTDVGGALSEMYSLIRRAAAKYDKAMIEAETTERRQILNKALAEIHRAEDALVQAAKTR